MIIHDKDKEVILWAIAIIVIGVIVEIIKG